MIFKTPFIAFQSEIYKLFTNADEMENLPVFDSMISMDEIMEEMSNQGEVDFIVVSDVSCKPSWTKTGAPFWDVSVRLEMFSNYNGRKKIGEIVNTICQVVTQYEDIFGINLSNKGYALHKFSIGESVIGSALMVGNITWQNGYITLNALVEQLEEEE